MSMFKKQMKWLRHASRNSSAFILSYLIPRSPKRWVFGSNMGFAGNAKYLYLYLKNHPEEGITPLWIAGNKHEYKALKSAGINVAKRWSKKGTWGALRAGYFVYNSYAPDIHLPAMGCAVKVNLWHGVGIKNIEYEISVGPLHDIFHSDKLSVRYDNKWFFIRPDIFLSTSPIMTDHFSRCFRIPHDRCIESSYPRNEILRYDRERLVDLIEETASEQMMAVIKRSLQFKRLYVYMPTMRDSGGDFFKSIGWDFDAINEALRKTDSCMIIKTHPLTYLDLSEHHCSNIFQVDRDTDPYPLLALSHVLITDYSSVYYDYILMPDKETLLLIPDMDEYLSADRDLAFPYDSMTGGKKLYSIKQLVEHIESGTGQSDDEKSENRAIARKFWANPDDTCHDLVAKILNHKTKHGSCWFTGFIRPPKA